MGKITDFEVITFPTTKLKVKATVEAFPQMTSSVGVICTKLNEIATTFKTLTTQDMTSSDFYDECDEIITIASYISDITKSYTGLLLLDAYQRIMSVKESNTMFADEIAAAEDAFNNTLQAMAAMTVVSVPLIASDMMGPVSMVDSAKLTAPVTEPTPTPSGTGGTPSGGGQSQGSPSGGGSPSGSGTPSNGVGSPSGGTPSNGGSPSTGGSAPVVDDTPPQAIVNDNNQVGRVVPGAHSPGTTDTTFAAQAYNFSDDEYRMLCALVYSEASEQEPYLYSDAMGVTSTILNRVENGYGSLTKVICNKNQFHGYQSKKYNAAMRDLSVIKPEMIDAINAVLAGERNTNALYFTGHGKYTSFREKY